MNNPALMELAACPFCGGKASCDTQYQNGDADFNVICLDEFCIGGAWPVAWSCPTQEEAIAKWNTRTQLRTAAAEGGQHGHAAACDELSTREVMVPCDCGCGRQCCAACGNDLGFIQERSTDSDSGAGRDGWLPIESAPKDGTIILVGGGTISAGDYRARPFTSVSIAFWYTDHWRGDDMQSHDEWWKHHPTHWQPLPGPPAIAGAAGEAK